MTKKFWKSEITNSRAWNETHTNKKLKKPLPESFLDLEAHDAKFVPVPRQWECFPFHNVCHIFILLQLTKKLLLPQEPWIYPGGQQLQFMQINWTSGRYHNSAFPPIIKIYYFSLNFQCQRFLQFFFWQHHQHLLNFSFYQPWLIEEKP